MARRIYKYITPLMNTTIHDVPLTAPVLCAADPQSGEPALWFEHSDGVPRRNVTFEVFGTGEQIPDSMEHFGSLVSGVYVWHIWGRNHA